MKLAIFDLDGVLVHTAHVHTDALRKAVTRCLGEAYRNISYLDAADGIRTVDKLRRLQQDVGFDDVTLQSINELKRQITCQNLGNATMTFQAVHGIQELKKHNIKVAVGTNTRREFAERLLDGWLLPAIDYMVCGDEVTNPKPDPEIFTTIIQHFQVSPADTHIFEDSESGRLAAHRAGANVIYVDPKELVTFNQITAFLPFIGRTS